MTTRGDAGQTQVSSNTRTYKISIAARPTMEVDDSVLYDLNRGFLAGLREGALEAPKGRLAEAAQVLQAIRASQSKQAESDAAEYQLGLLMGRRLWLNLANEQIDPAEFVQLYPRELAAEFVEFEPAKAQGWGSWLYDLLGLDGTIGVQGNAPQAGFASQAPQPGQLGPLFGQQEVAAEQEGAARQLLRAGARAATKVAVDAALTSAGVPPGIAAGAAAAAQ